MNKKTKKPLQIKVVGTGGIGLNVLPVLARYLNYNQESYPSVDLTLIDGDFFEEKNRDRQQFDDYGYKATVTAERYRAEFPRLTIHDVPVYLGDHNINQSIRENDIVLVCVDNHATRKLISNRAEQLKNVTIISGGNDLEDGNVIVHIRRDSQNLTPPLTSEFHPEIANPKDENPADIQMKGLGCAALVKSSPQLLITNNYIAANMLAALYNIINEDLFVNKVLKRPEEYAEIYCDVGMIGVASKTRKRLVKKGKQA